MESVPSREDWLLALCVLTRRNAFPIELRECVGERTRGIASVRYLMGKIP
jgi:hypothetical protein